MSTVICRTSGILVWPQSIFTFLVCLFWTQSVHLITSVQIKKLLNGHYLPLVRKLSPLWGNHVKTLIGFWWFIASDMHFNTWFCMWHVFLCMCVCACHACDTVHCLSIGMGTEWCMHDWQANICRFYRPLSRWCINIM